jgi:glycine/D-amino acid oxidase-like deaminating enzyme
MPSTSHPDALHFGRPADSFWEASAPVLDVTMPPLEGETQCDIAIIGGGYTGLSAALELREHYKADVHVLEAAEPGWGASGRNGGFACIGSHKLSYSKMINRYGLEATRQFYRCMRDAVDLVRANCSRYGIDAWISEGGEVTLAHMANRVGQLRDERDFLERTFGEKLELLSVEDLRVRGLHAPGFHGGLWNPTGFSIHPLNYARGLARAAVEAGAILHARSRVVGWDERAGRHVLTTAQGRLLARQIVVATNGYTPEDIFPWHSGRLMPALSNIIVTRPLSEAEREEQGWTSRVMAFDARNLLHYFRLLPDGRFLFGGRGGTDASDQGVGPMKRHMTTVLRQMFPVFGRAEITHFWRGFVCLAYDLVPYVGALDRRKSVWTAIAYHGNGVAMASLAGRAVARMMVDGEAAGQLPAVMRRRLARFPLAALRPYYLKGAYLLFHWQDER